MKPNEKVIRYTTDSAGRVRQWQCWFSTNSVGVWGIFYTDGLVTGKMKTPTFKEAKEKNIGKANYMSTEMQAAAMVIQETGKKERKNYFETPALATANKKWLPMLCPSGMKWAIYKDNKNAGIFYPAYASVKYDGARCNLFLQDGEIYAQTRTGKEWLNVDHIKKDSGIIEFFKFNPTAILDGELYNHDYKDNFEDLMSVIKKQKPTEAQKEFAAKEVEYHVYDVFMTDKPEAIFSERIVWMETMFETYHIPKFMIYAESMKMDNEAQFNEFHSAALALGYEGSILRLNMEYKVDSRAKQLLKRKELFDCEFVIDEVCEGVGSHKGLGSHMYISLNTVSGMNANDMKKIDQDLRQKAAPGKGWDHDMLEKLFKNRESLIGKVVTVEYFELTDKGRLRFPKFKAIRDYE